MHSGVKRLLKKVDSILFPRLYSPLDEYEEVIAAELVGKCDSLLDVGCGVTKHSPMYDLARNFGKIIGIDLFEPTIAENKISGNYHEYYVWDAKDIEQKFGPKSVDAILATDLIEHVDPKTGIELLDQFDRVARKKIILFTPNGFIPQDEYDDNKFQIHRSGWTVNDFRSRGYRVLGMNGLKFLRGEQARMRWMPEWFWLRISLWTQLFTRHFPRFAFHLLVIKDLD